MKFKIPNILTIGRIIIVPIFVATFFLPGFFGELIPFFLFVLASFTDYLDGLLARIFKEESKLGELLDPIADKILVAAALILLVMNGTIKNYEVIAAIIILTREILISGLREFLAKGKIKLPSYFVRFGVTSSLEMFIKNKEALEKRIRTKKTASLNPKQKKAVNYAIECISKVAPSFSSLYNSFVEDQGIYELDFKTIESKDLLGELKDSRDYDGKTIYLNKDLFKSNFGKFFAILTHEMGHVFGKDGEREFSDVLTHIIAQAVEKNSVISKYSKSWARYRA